MKIDFLDKIYRKELLEDETDKIYNKALEKTDTIPWWYALGMNQIESMAYLHGASFDEIAKWRYEGWPNDCHICGDKINPWEGGWTVKHNGLNVNLVHIECLS